MGNVVAILRRLLIGALLACAPALGQTPPADPPVSNPAVLPPAPVIPTPIPDASWAVRRNVYLRRLVSTQALVSTFPGAGIDQLSNFPREWERTGRGFGQRVASQYGRFAVGETIEFGVSAFRREDPRYYRIPDARVGKTDRARTEERRVGKDGRWHAPYSRPVANRECLWFPRHPIGMASASAPYLRPGDAARHRLTGAQRFHEFIQRVLAGCEEAGIPPVNAESHEQPLTFHEAFHASSLILPLYV